MRPTDSQRLQQIIRRAPPDGTRHNARYMRYVVLWLRVQDRTAQLQRRLDGLQAAIAAAMTVASPPAFVAAAERADQFATAAIDVAQLQVFADDVYQRLM